MQKLHLVGFTTDHEGLILSARRGSRSGSFVLVIGPGLEEAVDELRAKRAEEEAETEAEAPARPPRVESALSVREIQARLRKGRSVAEVAKAAGVDEAWVERFAPPVLAERRQVIDRVQGVTLSRARLGPSRLPIGESVLHHLADRGVALTSDEFQEAWTAQLVTDGRWTVRFRYRYRGRGHTLQYDLDEAAGEVAAADRNSNVFGYVAADGAATRPRPAAPRPTAKRAVVSTAFRADDASAPATTRSAKERERATSALRKAAAQRAVAADRAAKRRAKEKRDELARKERADRAAAAAAARAEREATRAAQATKAAKAGKAAKAKTAAKAQKAAKASKAPKAKTAAKAQTAGKAQTAAKASNARKRRTAATATTARANARAPKRTATKAATSTTTAKAAKKAGQRAPKKTTASAARKPAAAPRAVEAAPSPTAVISTAAPSQPAVRPTPTIEPLRPPRAAEGDEAVVRPRFRTGLVEPAEQGRPRPGSTPNGDDPTSVGPTPRPAPPLGRPRRTRPLRAT